MTHSAAVSTEPSKSQILGIDVGGTGIKAGVVDISTGELCGDRHYLDTPQPATPDAVAETIAKLASSLNWQGPIGIALPSVIHAGRAQIAHNIDKAWIGCEIEPLFARHLPSHPVSVLNDADAAGIAEVIHGSAKGRKGLVVLLTFGTGIGSAFLIDGRLIPNTEFGHILVQDAGDGRIDEAEHLAAASIRGENDWTFAEWAPHVSRVLNTIEDLLWPSVFVIGGGVSESADDWFPLLDCRTPLVTARFLNDAGLVGAAVYAGKAAGLINLDSITTSRPDISP